MVPYSNVDILLVEDSQDDIDLAMHALRLAGVANTISVVRNGEEALDFLFCRGAFSNRSFDQPPKMILLDLKLPKIDGLQVLKAIKSDPRTHATPVVILTSSNEERDLVESYRSGVNSYIQKPVEFAHFLESVKSLGHYWMVVNQSPMGERVRAKSRESNGC